MNSSSNGKILIRIQIKHKIEQLKADENQLETEKSENDSFTLEDFNEKINLACQKDEDNLWEPDPPGFEEALAQFLADYDLHPEKYLPNVDFNGQVTYNKY